MKWFSLPLMLSTSLVFADPPLDAAPELPMQGPMLEAPSAEGEEPAKEQPSTNPLRTDESTPLAAEPPTDVVETPAEKPQNAPPEMPVKTYATSVPVIDPAAGHVQAYPTFVGYGAAADPFIVRSFTLSRWCCEPPPGYKQELWADYCLPKQQHGHERCGPCRPCPTCGPIPPAPCPCNRPGPAVILHGPIHQPVAAPRQVIEMPVSIPAPARVPAVVPQESSQPAAKGHADETARRRVWFRNAKSIKEARSRRPIKTSHQTGRAG